MKKKALSLLLCSAMTVGMLTGCGGSGDDGAANTPAADTADEAEAPAAAEEADEAEAPAPSTDGEEVTLTVLAGQSTTDAGIEDMIDAALAEKYPNITLEWECTGWDGEFHPKMQQYMQSGLPDIIIGKAQDVNTYASQGLLGEIDATYLDRGLDAARENVTIDGKTYGLVYNALYQGVYYNKTMFAENGWEVPTTQEELQAIIDDCNAKGIVPFASHMVH